MLQQHCILFLISSSLCIFNFLLNISFSLVSALNTFFLAMAIFLVPHLQSGHMTVANSTCGTNAWSLNSFLNSFRIFEFIQKYFFKKIINNLMERCGLFPRKMWMLCTCEHTPLYLPTPPICFLPQLNPKYRSLPKWVIVLSPHTPAGMWKSPSFNSWCSLYWQ